MKKRILAIVMTIAMAMSLLPLNVLAAVSVNQRPPNPSKALVIGILNDDRADGEGEFPNEPSVTGYDYYYLQSNGNLSTSWSNVYLTRTDADDYINIEAFWNDNRLVKNYAGNAWGFYDPEGISLTDSTLVNDIPIDETAIIQKWMAAKRVNGNADDYKLLFYVLKYETGYSEGYHLDCKVVKKDNVTLSYNANKPASVTADVTVPSSTSVAKNTSVMVQDMPRAGKTLTGTNGHTYTFTDWNTEPDGTGTAYVEGNSVTVAANTVLYAQWRDTTTYTVTWVNYNDEVLETDSGVAYGAKAQYNGTAPTQPSDSHYTYTFAGWDVDKGNYSEATGVTENVTFKARYTPNAITFKATVEVVLNGTFDSEGNRIGQGTNEDITTVEKNAREDAVYLKKTGESTYIPLSRTAKGVYSASGLSNGDYYIYVKDGDTYSQVGTQALTIANNDRTRYLPYYSVEYKAGAEGVTGMPTPATEYYYIGSGVDVSSAEPEHEGYIFRGWEAGNTTYQPEDTLTDVITQKYELTAQWEPAAKVNVIVIVDHSGRNQTLLGDDDVLRIHLTQGQGSNYYPWGPNYSYNEVAGTLQTVPVSQWNVDENNDGKAEYRTQYTELPVLSSNAGYSAHATIPGYEYEDIDVEKRQNEYTVTIRLKYDPEGFDLPFTVKIAEGTPEGLIPAAVDVKVTYWSRNSWTPINEHTNQSVEVAIDKETLTGTGFVHVPAHVGDQENNPYLYRIDVVRVDMFEYQLTATTRDNKNYTTSQLAMFPQGAYTAVVNVNDSDKFAGNHNNKLEAAYAKNDKSVKGSIVAEVTPHPYTVTLDPNGGQWSAEDTNTKSINNCFTVPELDEYVPTCEGYTFAGWWHSGQYHQEHECVGGEYIRNCHIQTGGTLPLKAHWKQNITVEGTVVIDLGFPCTDTSRTVTVALQMHRGDGTYEVTNFTQQVSLTPVENTNYATGTFQFTNVPDIGQYRVNVIAPAGGTVKYQNEPDSLNEHNLKNPEKYNEASYVAKCGSDTTAVVNVLMEARLFALGFLADASAIGEGFRPADLKLDLRHDHRSNGDVTYEVIKDDLTIASLGDSGVSTIQTVEVPPYHANGYLYDYVISVLNYDISAMDINDKHYYHYTDTEGYSPDPFTIHYNGPANYDAAGVTENGIIYKQDVILKAIFEPNKYNITYNLDGGTWPSADERGPSQHTWSFDTEINVTPVREGYVFTGWDAEPSAAFDAENNKIPAAVWQDVKLTANWELDTWNDQQDNETGDGTPDKYQVRFVYLSEDTDEGTVSPQMEIITLRNNDGELVESADVNAVGATAAAKYGYAFDLWTTDTETAQFSKTTANTGNITLNDAQGGYSYFFEASFAEDKFDEPDNNLTDGDGIPDKYQKQISFLVVNGSWNDGSRNTKTAIVTLYNEDNQPDQNGTYTLTTNEIPDVGDKPETGYKAGSWDTQPGGPHESTVDSFVYTYLKDDSQKKTLTYTVQHKIGDEVKHTQTYSKEVWVNDPTTIEIEKGSLNQKSYTGYKFDSITPDVKEGNKVDTGSIITLTYVKDEGQTKTLTYTVKYYKDGVEVEADCHGGSTTVWVNDPDIITVDTSKININDKYVGYKLDSQATGEIPASVPTDTIINVYYVKDTSQQHSVSAQVQYFYGENLEAAKAKTAADAVEDVQTATGWIGEDTTVTVTANTTDKFVGYKYGSTEGALSYTVAANAPTDTTTHIVKVYYVKDATKTKTLTYSVEFYKDGTMIAADNFTEVQSVWVNDPNTLPIPDSLEAEALVGKYPGYMLEKIDPDPIPNDIPDETVIKIYYAKDVLNDEEDKTDKGDGIPDKYQAKVTFDVKNGQWDPMAGKDQKIAIVTLRDKSGNPSEQGVYTLTEGDVPGVGKSPDEKFTTGRWDTEPVGQEITQNTGYTYTYTRLAEPLDISYAYKVEHYKEQADGTYVLADTDLPAGFDKLGQEVTAVIDADKYDGFTYDATVEGTISSGKIIKVEAGEGENAEPVMLTLKLYYSIDNWNDEKDVIDEGDGIPDKYQVAVVFKSADENKGTVTGDGIVQVFTLPENAESGTVDPVMTDVTATAKSGYRFSIWTRDAGTAAVNPDDPIENVAGGTVIEFYAQWNKKHKPNPPVDPPALNTEDHYAYIVGYPDGNVKPDGNITRAEVATIFFRLLTDESRDAAWSTTNDYSDVRADQWFNNAISTLSNAGILNGYNDGTFRPNAPITRAEFAKIASSFFSHVDSEYQGLFPDVPASKWYAAYVEAASELGLITGYPDGTFRPEQNITRAEACTIVNRTIDRHPHEDQLHEDMIVWPDNPAPGEAGHQWYYEQIQEATNSHEYVMENAFENWTELLENRDWAAFEKMWSDSNSAPGGDVMK